LVVQNTDSGNDINISKTIFLRQGQYVTVMYRFPNMTLDTIDFVYDCTMQCTDLPLSNTPKGTGISASFLLDIASNLPDINQLEYLRYYLQLNQAFITFDLPDQVIITKFSEFLDKYRSGQVNDFSQYFVNVDNVQFTNELAKENWFKYKIDSTDGEQTSVNYAFNHNSGIGEKTLYTAPFAPSLQSQMQCTDTTNATTGTFTTTLTKAWTRNSFKAITSGILVLNNYYIVTSASGGFNATNCGSTNIVGDVFLAKATTPTAWGSGSVELYDFERNGYEPRNVILNSTDAESGDYAIYTDYYYNGSVSNISTDIPLLTFSELTWTNLVNTDWLANLEDVQRMTIVCRLPEEVFFNIDLSKPTFFKQLQQAIFIEKIEGYRGGWETCKIVGIKIVA